ncbi:hypothetical protein DUNSADRAFT_12703, partial [Dunaliella salina]
ANPLSTDVEILYQRLLGQDSYAVKAWFDDYCEAMEEPGAPADSGSEDREEEEEEEEEEVDDETKQRGKKRARRAAASGGGKGRKRGGSKAGLAQQ